MSKMRIPAFKLTAEPLDDEARKIEKSEWAAPEIDTRHQLGGEPLFIQKAKWPVCNGCGQKMTFYGQLGSISDEICLADAGLVYVFVCFDCFQSASFIQSY